MCVYLPINEHLFYLKAKVQIMYEKENLNSLMNEKSIGVPLTSG